MFSKSLLTMDPGYYIPNACVVKKAAERVDKYIQTQLRDSSTQTEAGYVFQDIVDTNTTAMTTTTTTTTLGNHVKSAAIYSSESQPSSSFGSPKLTRRVSFADDLYRETVAKIGPADKIMGPVPYTQNSGPMATYGLKLAAPASNADEEGETDKTNLFTINCARTQGHSELYEKLDITVEMGNDKLSFKPPKKATCAQLHSKIRQKLGISDSQKLNLALLSWVPVPNDTRGLWQCGIRHFPAVIAALPCEAAAGDQLVVKFVKRGNNVNGDRPYHSS